MKIKVAIIGGGYTGLCCAKRLIENNIVDGEKMQIELTPTAGKLQKEEVESVCWLSINEIHSLMNEDKFFRNNYEEFEILLNWLKEGDNYAT